ncbi:unnamed protein product, partial [marine sediment metagenome]
ENGNDLAQILSQSRFAAQYTAEKTPHPLKLVRNPTDLLHAHPLLVLPLSLKYRY